MKQSKKILFISQEILPYVDETAMSSISRQLPQASQEAGYETRTFMPKYGNVNERRNQLHEVIRLSGMNLIIDDTDHPLIIKVASIQLARMQIYFIDNEDYFKNRLMLKDADGNEYPDNDERSIFYVRGVLETVKKLRWTPDIILCQGHLTALAPLYIKKAYNDDPFFKNSKVVYSVFDDEFKNPFRNTFATKLCIDGVEKDDVKSIQDKEVDFETLTKLAIDYSDATIQAGPAINKNVLEYMESCGKPMCAYSEEVENSQRHIDFFNNL